MRPFTPKESNLEDYKKAAASEALAIMTPGQSVGMGAGRTIADLAEMIAENQELTRSVSLATSSAETRALLRRLGLRTVDTASLAQLDLYFDGCDQVDRQLNAFKTGAGIHTDEKLLAAMASRFIILGDTGKLVGLLDTQYPICIELLPEALASVIFRLERSFSLREAIVRKDPQGDPVRNGRGSLLLDAFFHELPPLADLDRIRMWPGVVDHSLFHGMATGAILCGPGGTKKLGEV